MHRGLLPAQRVGRQTQRPAPTASSPGRGGPAAGLVTVDPPHGTAGRVVRPGRGGGLWGVDRKGERVGHPPHGDAGLGGGRQAGGPVPRGGAGQRGWGLVRRKTFPDSRVRIPFPLYQK